MCGTNNCPESGLDWDHGDDCCVEKRVCRDANNYCTRWAGSGYCSGYYAAYMKENCPKACGLCGQCDSALVRTLEAFVKGEPLSEISEEVEKEISNLY